MAHSAPSEAAGLVYFLRFTDLAGAEGGLRRFLIDNRIAATATIATTTITPRIQPEESDEPPIGEESVDVDVDIDVGPTVTPVDDPPLGLG